MKEENSGKLKNTIIVENFPSSVELYNLLNTFLDKKGYSSNYEAELRGSKLIQFSFGDSDIAYEFMKQLNYEKMTSPLYSKVKTTLLLDTNNSNENNYSTLHKLNNVNIITYLIRVQIYQQIKNITLLSQIVTV